MKRRFPKEVAWAEFAASLTGDSGKRLAKLWTSKGKRATHKRERREAKKEAQP